MSYGIGGCCPQCGGEPMTAGFMHRAECPTLRTNRLFEDGVFAVPARSSDPVPQGPRDFPWRIKPFVPANRHDRRQGWWEVYWAAQQVGYPTGGGLFPTEEHAREVADALNRYEARRTGEQGGENA